MRELFCGNSDANHRNPVRGRLGARQSPDTPRMSSRLAHTVVGRCASREARALSASPNMINPHP